MNYFKNLSEEQSRLNLKSEKIELATIYDDLKGSIGNANKGFVEATKLVSKAQKEVKKSISDNKTLLKELDKAEKLIKDIGLDSELKKVQKAQNQVKENINELDSYLTNLITL